MNIGTLVGYLDLDDRKFRSTLKQIPSEVASTGDDAGSKMGKGLFDGAMKFAAPLAAAFSAVAVVGFAKSAIKEASDLSESANAINVTFGTAAAGISKLGAEAATSLGLSNVEFNGLAVRFSAFAKTIAGPGGDVVATMDQMTKRASDFASVMNLDVAQAAELFQSGLAGETEPLRKFGIDLSAAAVEAYAYANGIAASGKELTEAEKVQARYGLLMQSTAQTQGDFANTSAGLANGMRILKSSFSDVKANIGTAFLPFMAMGVQALNAMMGPLKEMTSHFADFGNAIGKIFSEAGGGMAGFTASFAHLGDVIGANLSGEGLIGIFNALAGLRSKLFDAIMQALPGVINAFMAFLPQMVSFFTQQFIPQMVTSFMTTINQIIALLATSIPQLVGQLALMIPLMVALIGQMLPEVITMILGQIPSMLNAALTMFQSIVSAFVSMIPILINTIVELFPQVVNAIISMLPKIIESAITLFTGIIEGLVKVVPVLLTAIVDLIPPLVESILKILPSLIQASLTMFLGMVTALLKALPQILTAIIDMIPHLVKTIVSMIPEIISASVQLFLGMVQATVKALPSIIKAVIGIIPQLTGALIGAIPQLIEAGFQLLIGLTKGIIDNAPSILVGVAQTIGDLLTNSVKEIFGIHSPSRVFYGFGEMLMIGMANGISDNRDAIMSEIGKLNSAVDLASMDTNLNSNLAVSAMPDSTRGIMGGVSTSSTTKSFTYVAAPGSSFSAEEELFAALNRPRAVAF